MPYAFNLTLDPKASLEIERVYAGLAGLGISERDLVTQYGPCVTILVVTNRVRANLVTDVLGWKLPTMSAMPVSFTGPCIILGTPPTLSLRVDPTDQLLALHDAIFTELPEEEVHLHYRPAYWQPHLKLSNVHGDQAAAAGLVAALATRWQPLNGVFDRLEVIQYPPVQSIWQAPLKSADKSIRGT